MNDGSLRTIVIPPLVVLSLTVSLMVSLALNGWCSGSWQPSEWLPSFQNAYNLLLVVLVKGGSLRLSLPVLACLWLLGAAASAVKAHSLYARVGGVAGVG